MAIFEISTFATLCKLLLAARKLATDGDALNRGKALADLAQDAKALNAALQGAGLAPLAAAMEKRAKNIDAFLTHEGRAKDDARLVFWQAVPHALADPALMTGDALDPDATAATMIAAIRQSPVAHDFHSTDFAESYFRQVMSGTLKEMFADAAFIESITPDLWRETLRAQGITLEAMAAVKDDTTEILALVRELLEVKQTTVHQDTLIAMARKIRPHVANREEALRELERAADIASEQMERGLAGSNLDTFVDGVLRRLAEMTEAGELDAAVTTADDAVDRAEAGLTQLLNAAIKAHLVAYDAEGAARQITKRLTLETPDPADIFDALRCEELTWYGRGNDRGLRLDLEVAIAIARTVLGMARSTDERGLALNDLGLALAALGEREAGSGLLEEAVTSYRDALGEYTRERAPLKWAATQHNLGAALMRLGQREAGTRRLDEAVAAFEAALAERTRDRVPFDWAKTQGNLGSVHLILGERQVGAKNLEKAVAAQRCALEELPRDREPLSWAMTQNNLGNALRALAKHEAGTESITKAVSAYREALLENTRDRVPLEWAMTQNNLGNAYEDLGQRAADTGLLELAALARRNALLEYTRHRTPLDWAGMHNNLGLTFMAISLLEAGTKSIEEAVTAFHEALKERTRQRVPLDWAATQGNLALALAARARRTDGNLEEALTAIDAAIDVFRASGAEAHVDMGQRIRRSINGDSSA